MFFMERIKHTGDVLTLKIYKYYIFFLRTLVLVFNTIVMINIEFKIKPMNIKFEFPQSCKCSLPYRILEYYR